MARRLRIIFCLISVMFFIYAANGQTTRPEPQNLPKTIYRDSDGNIISNNEFVDIRMANFHYPDATIRRLLPDGIIELRLQKIPQEGMRSPAVTFSLISGEGISLSDLSGKVVVLHFWFIGCPACRAMRAQLSEFRKKFAGRDDIVFIAVTADSVPAVRNYLIKEPLNYLQAADASDVIGAFNIGGYPKNVVISKSGEIVYWRSTIKAWDKFEAAVRAELAK